MSGGSGLMEALEFGHESYLRIPSGALAELLCTQQHEQIHVSVVLSENESVLGRLGWLLTTP